MSDHNSDNAYAGSIKVSCHVAAKLLNNDDAIKAWFRPDGFIDYNHPALDTAFVWLTEGKGAEDALLQENTSESEGTQA